MVTNDCGDIQYFEECSRFDWIPWELVPIDAAEKRDVVRKAERSLGSPHLARFDLAE